MRTPAEYSKNLKNHVITVQMLLECLYSSNKRAKNWRDKEREWRSCRYDEYDNESKARDKKKEYYRQKEIMLSVLKPVCIHRETIYNQRRKRIYDYEDEYEEYLNADAFFHTGEYWDNDLNEYVQFGDVYLDCDPVYHLYHYYLFYDVGGNHTFHTPINEEDLFLYDLEIKDIDQLYTTGDDIADLLSNQFVTKVVDLIKSEDFKLIENI